LQRRTIAPIYLGLAAVLLVLTGFAAWCVRRQRPGSGLHLEFLLLGLGFTLVESAAIVRMALLFGSTWVVNCIVFLAVLVTVFLANRMVVKGSALWLAWPVLVAALAGNALLSLDALLSLPFFWRTATAAALVGVPIYCASVCFSRLFARAGDVGGAFGMNLVGAMAGGMCEYVSMLLGMRGVLWVAAAVYGGAGVWARRSWRRATIS
jgi:hypothetical protein